MEAPCEWDEMCRGEYMLYKLRKTLRETIQRNGMCDGACATPGHMISAATTLNFVFRTS